MSGPRRTRKYVRGCFVLGLSAYAGYLPAAVYNTLDSRGFRWSGEVWYRPDSTPPPPPPYLMVTIDGHPTDADRAATQIINVLRNTQGVHPAKVRTVSNAIDRVTITLTFDAPLPF